MSKETVYILGAGFSRAIGLCKVMEKEILPPLDADFFGALEQEELLIDLLSDKPCLTLFLHWAGIYDKFYNKLLKTNYSLEKLWTQLNMMLKMNSSITGFPNFGIYPSKKSVVNGHEFEEISNLDYLQPQMPNEERLLYRSLSQPTGENFFNPEGMVCVLAEYEMKKLIFEVYSGTVQSQNKTDLTARFKQLVNDSPLISFNYDCLVEKSFEKHFLFCYDERTSLKDKNRLIIKPHGSLAWVMTKRYSQEEGTIEVIERLISRETKESSFKSRTHEEYKVDINTPIIIPMSPGKENFLSSLADMRINICNDNALNHKREFIDCVVSYAKMLEVIKNADILVFIGYSFPPTDYESIILFDLALNSSQKKECHICIKGDHIPNPELSFNRVTYYKDGFEHFLEEFIKPI